jgi:hypothetical protein
MVNKDLQLAWREETPTHEYIFVSVSSFYITLATDKILASAGEGSHENKLHFLCKLFLYMSSLLYMYSLNSVNEHFTTQFNMGRNS